MTEESKGLQGGEYDIPIDSNKSDVILTIT